MTDWRSQPLHADHELATFDCGVDDLNSWLREHASRAQQSDTARTFVWTAQDSVRAVGYYSVSATQVRRAEITGSFAGGYSIVPAYLLARLALDRSLHARRLGSELLVDALETIVRAADSAAARLIVVDAIDDGAAAFYRRHDFVPVKDNPHRLVMKVATARKALGVSSVQISPDPELRLVSVELNLPDGRTLSVVASAPEIRAIAARLSEEADRRQGETTIVIDLPQVVRDVLGRDPFAQ